MAEAIELQGGPHPFERLPPADPALYVPYVFACIAGKKAKILQKHIPHVRDIIRAAVQVRAGDLIFVYPDQERLVCHAYTSL